MKKIRKQPRQVIHLLGGPRNVAQKMGLRPPTVRGWQLDGVPEKHHLAMIQFAKQCGLDISAQDLSL